MTGRTKPLVKRRSVHIGHKTTISLECEFWNAVKEIAAAQNLTLDEVVTLINGNRQHANLSSAVRLYVLDHYVRLASGKTDDKATK